MPNFTTVGAGMELGAQETKNFTQRPEARMGRLLGEGLYSCASSFHFFSTPLCSAITK